MIRVFALALLLLTGSNALGAIENDPTDVRDQLFKLQKDNARLLELLERIQSEQQESRAPAVCVETASRLDRVEQQIGNLSRQLQDLSTHWDDLLAEIRSSRVAGARPGAGEVPHPEEPGGQSAPAADPGLSAADLYHAAYADYSRRQYDLALTGFQRAYDADRRGPLADDSMFWVGETLMAQGKAEAALAAFERTIEEFPSGDKRLTAQLRRGIVLIDGGKVDEGRRQLNDLIASHPATPEALSAREYLKRKGLNRQ